MTRYFESLSIMPFEPRFVEAATIHEAADLINRPHEDYPQRVKATEDTISTCLNVGYTGFILGLMRQSDPDELKLIHSRVFGDTPHGGRFREVDVRVGYHLPPSHTKVEKLMDELHRHYLVQPISTKEELIDYYIDLETCHPFVDGNGRVGGIVVAVLSKELLGYYLAPLQ